MRYDIKYDSGSRCVVCKLLGPLHLSDLPQYVSDVSALLDMHNCKRVLQDLTEVDFKLSTFEFLDVPKLIREKDVKREVKRAIVFAKDAEDWRFHETVSVNRAERVRVFTDFNQAKQWLTD